MTTALGKYFCVAAKWTAAAFTNRATRRLANAGNYVRLEGHQRDVEHRTGEHRGAGGVSADAHDDIGTEVADDLRGLRDGARQVEESLESCCEADAIERADGDQFERKAGGGDDAGFHAARGSDKKHFGVVTGLEFLGDGDGGDDVAARASACDDDAHD